MRFLVFSRVYFQARSSEETCIVLNPARITDTSVPQHFEPWTLRHSLVWWVRTVRTDRHWCEWCRSVSKTLRTCRTVLLQVPNCPAPSAEVSYPVFGRPFVKRFALCYRTVDCLSVTLVNCGQTVGWIKMPLGMEVGLCKQRHTIASGL